SSLATTVWPPPLGTAETSSVSRPAGSPPPSASSIGRTAAATPPHGLRGLSGKRTARSDRSAETVWGGGGTCAHALARDGGAPADQPHQDALRLQPPLGHDVAVAPVRRAQHGAPAQVHEPLQRRGGLIHEGRDDVALARLAPLEHRKVAVQDVGVDHRVAMDAQRPDPVGPRPADAEDGGIDGDRLVGRLLLHRRQPRRDRAEDGHLEELRLHGGGLEAPGAARQLLDLPLVGQGAQVADHGRLAAKAEPALDLPGGRRHALLPLELPDEVEDLLLALGQHGVYGSEHTDSSLPLGSVKWNRRPPGYEKISRVTLPPWSTTRRRASSSRGWKMTTRTLPAAIDARLSERKKPPETCPSAKEV